MSRRPISRARAVVRRPRADEQDRREAERLRSEFADQIGRPVELRETKPGWFVAIVRDGRGGIVRLVGDKSPKAAIRFLRHDGREAA